MSHIPLPYAFPDYSMYMYIETRIICWFEYGTEGTLRGKNNLVNEVIMMHKLNTKKPSPLERGPQTKKAEDQLLSSPSVHTISSIIIWMIISIVYSRRRLKVFY